MTAAPNPEEKRRSIRHPLTGDLTGALVSAKSGSTVPCVAVDVSEKGLRVVLALDLQVGAPMTLRMDGREIPLVVRWLAKEPSRKGYFSCGLEVTAAVDLLALFTRVGWLDDLKNATGR